MALITGSESIIPKKTKTLTKTPISIATTFYNSQPVDDYISELSLREKEVTRSRRIDNFKKVWCQGRKISLQRRLRVYDAQVVSVLLYNSSRWAVPQNILEKLDIAHRKHLRSILKIKWTDRISNVKLYEMTKTVPLSTRGEQSRLGIF